MSLDSKKAFQELIPGNHCFGCGPDNEAGLRIKSYWSKPGEAVSRFEPAPYHSAGPAHFLNGGIIGTIIDCHSICTAWAAAYEAAGGLVDANGEICFATGTLTVKYLAPADIDAPVTLVARIVAAMDKKTEVYCTLESRNTRCAEATIIAVRVPAEWHHGRK